MTQLWIQQEVDNTNIQENVNNFYLSSLFFKVCLVCTISEAYMTNESYLKEIALLQEALVRYIEIDFIERIMC